MIRFALVSFLFLIILFSPVSVPLQIHADTVDEIKAQIADINRQRAALDAEIAGYQKQLNVLSGQKQTLQGAIQTIDVSRNKTAAQIKEIQQKIAAATLTLNKLGIEIHEKEESISLDRSAVAASLRAIDSTDDSTLIEQILGATDLADAWVTIDNLSTLNEALSTHRAALAEAKTVLASQHQAVASTKTELSSANVDLSNQKKALDVQKAAKATLLSQTQSTEAAYQELIAKKRAQQAQFEAALSQLEDSLTTVVDSTQIAAAGSGVLKWPFSDAFMAGCAAKQGALGNIWCVTQYFGNTSFSTANPQIYNGSGHNAIDIGVPTGTPVEASLAGTVMDTGNTDSVPGCYSFGKWVVIKHSNGLATLYAHLSSIQVSAGQSVSTGSVIGYSGMTGYATGPHLHFGVYAAQGIQILTLAQYRGATSPCANAKMPVAPKDAYLNPMSYL
ncbi:MAG TPA: peptidoglycan DD-metalloendopeptidase family protein [Candidatus Paceibacterota bacterium]|nr:peptidoglycan DD-metalloendopeptidase family protein [Candidatus Paceibacterota bacterium]